MKNNLDMTNIPEHIAVIMDGNGRWAKKRLRPRLFGHNEGAQRVQDIIKASIKIGVKYLTVYAFSTENWNRPEDEVSGLFNLLVKFIDKNLEEVHEAGVKINILGNIEPLPEISKAKVIEAMEKTKDNSTLVFNIALNYGSRDEILTAVNNLIHDTKKGIISNSDITESLFSSYLYTKDIPDPDLMIRTSGEQRLSNFLLWQLAYSEFVFSSVLWPEFTEEEYYKAIAEYQLRNRRFGKI